MVLNPSLLFREPTATSAKEKAVLLPLLARYSCPQSSGAAKPCQPAPGVLPAAEARCRHAVR